ncbi:MAG TPA: PQQ-dependent sugar dehydrogenase [Steroidobacteraceae bacterium]|jgi:glucose/arabinose dehydrogenase|nr:PQQ-dependent sugar dehydrogenase [Steroidobacteraceae bacterium]
MMRPLRWLACLWLTLTPALTLAQNVKVDVLTDKLDAPWGLAQLPDGEMLLSERSGALWRLDARGVRLAKIENVPAAYVESQGGLFDIALHPQFATNATLYLSFAAGNLGHNTLRVVRAVLRGNRLTDVRTVFDSTPKSTAVHYGGRLGFMKDGTLLVTIGDGYDERYNAQRLGALLGKVARINDDGTAPPDNPFVRREGAAPAVWSYGHRNPQGLAVDPLTGVVYLSEHGPQGGDEINVIEPGVNYGWPVATHGIDYTGGRISPFATYEGMREPLVFWDPSIAPAGIAVYRGNEFPEWNGDLLVAVLKFTQLRRVDLEGGRVVGEHFLLADRSARFRHVLIAADGAILALVESVEGKERSGQLLRLSRAAP